MSTRRTDDGSELAGAGEQAEAALRPLTAAIYRSFFECAPVGLIIASSSNRCLEVNPTMCLMMGFTRHEMVGMSLSECVNRTEPPRLGLPLDLVAGKGEYDQVWQFRRKDGSLFDAETLATKMADGTRLGFVRDIGERKRKDARLRRLLDSNAQGVMFWNIAGEIVSANDAFLRIVGYSRGDLEAGLIDWAAMTPGEYAELDRSAIEELATTGVCTPMVKEFIRKDGSRVSVVVGAASFADNSSEGVCFVLDNTARKQAETGQSLLGQRLRDQQFYTRSLIESNLDALMTTDPAGSITDVNKQMEVITGRTRDELIGTPSEDHFTEPLQAKAAIKRVMREGHITNYELTVRSRDEKLTVVSYNASTFSDRDRIVQGVVAAARDITERKVHEHALREATHKIEQAHRVILELNARLEQQVLDRTTKLESARRELEEANQRFAIATDCAGIGIWELDVAGQSLTWDDWMYRIYGYARGPEVEPYALWANSLHVDDRARCEAQIGAAIRGDGEFDTEFRIVRPDGDVRHVKAVSRTSYGADGRAVTMTGVNMDVTEQRRAEGATRAIGCP
jgi:PAS domain S-box-containing protein